VIQTEPLSVRVVAIEPLSPRLKRITLQNARGGLLPLSQPGAHLTLTLPGPGRGHRNAYSIVSPCDRRDHYQLIIRRAPASRGGSRHVHEVMAVGDVLEASAPNSQFSIQSQARKHLMIAGGVGLTPMLSLTSALRARGAHTELHQIAQVDEVAVFEALLAGERNVHIHTGRAKLDLTNLLARQPLGTHLYCCGPQALMEAARDAALALGWPETSLHQESFGAAGGAPFILRLARSGLEIAVGEHDTMLEAMEAAGVAAPSLCRGGACGVCLTSVIEGAPEHRDHVLSEAERAEGRKVLPCVSRSTTPYLVLDL
jgi:ferredoxin-NADP reductase